MEQYKRTLSELQNDTIKVMQCLSRLLMSNSESKSVIEKGIDDYFYELESLCVKSRTVLEGYREKPERIEEAPVDSRLNNVYGYIDVTFEGWLHISLNPFTCIAAVFTPQGLGVLIFIAIMYILILCRMCLTGGMRMLQ